MRTFLLCLMLVWASSANADANVERARVHVAGTGSTFTVPDHAKFQFEVTVTAPSAMDAQRSVEQTLEQVISGLDGFDVDRSTLQAAHLQVAPQYRWQPEQRQRVFEGYQVTRRASFTLESLDQLGAVYQALVKGGATSVNPAILDTHQRGALATKMLAAAFEDARVQAEAIAQASGGKLGAALEVTTMGDSVAPRPMVARMSAEAADAGNPVYETGQLEIRKQVQVTFALENTSAK